MRSTNKDSHGGPVACVFVCVSEGGGAGQEVGRGGILQRSRQIAHTAAVAVRMCMCLNTCVCGGGGGRQRLTLHM